MPLSTGGMYCGRKRVSLIINDPPEARLSDDDIATWRSIPTAVISDELNRACAMDAAIKPIAEGQIFAGLALTVRTMVGDNAALHYAMAGAWPGCILVVDARGHMDTAVWGGVLTHAALVKGVSALVVDGSVRDVDEIRQTELAVFTRGVVPNGPHKGFGGGVNTAFSCAGVAVNPGDLVVGDADGVVVMRPDQMDGLLERCRARIAKEEGILAKLDAGVDSYVLQGLPPPDSYG